MEGLILGEAVWWSVEPGRNPGYARWWPPGNSSCHAPKSQLPSSLPQPWHNLFPGQGLAGADWRNLVLPRLGEEQAGQRGPCLYA